jgi:hypothetical protein
LVKGGSISVRLNDRNSPYFKPGKGLRQGDPLSPLLFNLVVDVFTRLLSRTANKGYLRGLMTSLYPQGVISLQYADDTLLFLDNNERGACHLKWLKVCFEHLSGMKINYHKSDLTQINLEEEEACTFARNFCCKMGAFPFRYLGAPLHHEKLSREDIQPVVDKVIGRIPGWKGRLLSYTARLTLLKACLTSIPIYLMSIIKFPKWTVAMINSYMANFFWNDQKNNHKYHLSNWQSLAQRKENGGLGIPHFRNLNLCLLVSWVQRYYDYGSKLWRDIIDCKYNTAPNLFCCRDRNVSPFWKGMLWAAQAAKMGYRWKPGNGERITFWEDLCLVLVAWLSGIGKFISLLMNKTLP